MEVLSPATSPPLLQLVRSERLVRLVGWRRAEMRDVRNMRCACTCRVHMAVLFATHVNTRLPGPVCPGEENGRKWLRSAADETERVRVETRLSFMEYLFKKSCTRGHIASVMPRETLRGGQHCCKYVGSFLGKRKKCCYNYLNSRYCFTFLC